MAAAGSQRLAQLPGYDTAPDVYETGDVDDDTNSTQQTHSPVPSEASDTSDEEDDDASYGVSRRRLYPERARSRFAESRGVVSKGADLSDRVDGKRKGYRVQSRARDVDGDETLEARIARLRREIEECKAEADAHKEAADDEGDEVSEGEGDLLDDCDTLSKLLAGIDVSCAERKGHRRKGSVFHDAPTVAPPPPGTAATHREDITDEHSWARISAFDSRLAALESVLGISSLDSITDSPTTPILPSLTLLDHQLASLTSATSLASLEHVSSRIQKLKLEAQALSRLQRQTISANGTAAPKNGGGSEDPGEEDDHELPTLLSPHDMTRLQTLYTLIPNLQSLAPTVPALVTRLRSLRTLHTAAATVAADLDTVQQRQAQMDRELHMWRDGLQKVEQAVKHADEANGRNGNLVQAWVEDLERRMTALGR